MTLFQNTKQDDALDICALWLECIDILGVLLIQQFHQLLLLVFSFAGECFLFLNRKKTTHGKWALKFSYHYYEGHRA